MYVVAYFMGLAFYYGAIKPNLDVPKTSAKSFVPTEQYEYTPPLPMPKPKGSK
jgi:hypothetical protein